MTVYLRKSADGFSCFNHFLARILSESPEDICTLELSAGTQTFKGSFHSNHTKFILSFIHSPLCNVLRFCWIIFSIVKNAAVEFTKLKTSRKFPFQIYRHHVLMLQKSTAQKALQSCEVMSPKAQKSVSMLALLVPSSQSLCFLNGFSDKRLK